MLIPFAARLSQMLGSDHPFKRFAERRNKFTKRRLRSPLPFLGSPEFDLHTRTTHIVLPAQ